MLLIATREDGGGIKKTLAIVTYPLLECAFAGIADRVKVFSREFAQAGYSVRRPQVDPDRL